MLQKRQSSFAWMWVKEAWMPEDTTCLLLPSLQHKWLCQSGLVAYAGVTCLLGGSPNCGSDCSGAPMLPLLYIAFNLGFNIAALNLLKTAGISVLPLCLQGCALAQHHLHAFLKGGDGTSLALPVPNSS